MRRLILLALPLLLTSAAARPTPPPTLCRVQATYTPVAWPTWTPPEQRFRRIVVTLRPGCPPDGQARVRLVHASGRVLPETPYYVLTPGQRASLFIPDRPPTSLTSPGWSVYWLSASGRPYLVPQTLMPGGGP